MVHFFGDLGNHERLKLVIDWDPGPARNQAFTGIPAKNGQSRPRLEVDSRYEFRHFSSCLARAAHWTRAQFVQFTKGPYINYLARASPYALDFEEI